MRVLASPINASLTHAIPACVSLTRENLTYASLTSLCLTCASQTQQV